MPVNPDNATKKVLDRELWDWYNCKHQPSGVKVSKTMLQARAKWAYNRAGMDSFKASDGWYRRFISRWRNFELTAGPTQKTPVSTIEPASSVHATLTVQSAITSTSGVETTKSIASTSALATSDSTSTIDSKNALEFISVIDSTAAPMLHTSDTAFTCDIEHLVAVEPSNNLDLTASVEAICSELGNKPDVSRHDETATFNLNLTSSSFCPFTKETDENAEQLSYINNIVNNALENNSVGKSFTDLSGNINSYNTGINFSTSGFNTENTVDDKASNVDGGIVDNFQPNNGTVPNDSESYVNEYEGEIIDCLSKFIDTSELSQTSMDFFYDSEDSSFSTTQNAFLLAETENQSSYENLLKSKESPHKSGHPSHKKTSSVAKMQRRKRGERYLPQFKEKVLSYVANRHTMRQAATKYKIDEMTISRWRTEKTSRKARRAAGGEVVERTPADQQFLTWLRRCREREVEVTADELRRKAKQLVEGDATENKSKWFVMWTNRLQAAKTYVEGMENATKKKETNIQYAEAFKLEVAAFAEKRSQIMAAKMFNVSRKRVFEWLKSYRKNNRTETTAEASQATDKKRAINLPDVEVDEMLWSWYQQQEPKPDNQQVRAKGRELFSARGHTTVRCSHGWFRRWCSRHRVTLRHSADAQLLQWTLTQIEANKTLSHQNLQVQALRLLAKQRPGFKASSSWVLRFCRRHPHLLERTPTLATPLPAQLSTKIARFRSAVRAAAVPPAAVGNVDEVHLSFAAAAGDKRPLLLRRSDMENCHATVVLACLADGNMLPPAVILKTPSGGEPLTPVDSPNVLVWYQANAHLDDAGMAAWLERVWFTNVPTPNLLIADCFPPHSTRDVKQAFVERGCAIKIVPGGCTSKLQPLDVSISRAFTCLVMQQWQDHQKLQAGTLPWETTSKFKMPDVGEITKWVDSAYRHIQRTRQETIRRCFLATGLTVASNHSEDHFIENLSMIPSDTDNTFVTVTD